MSLPKQVARVLACWKFANPGSVFTVIDADDDEELQLCPSVTTKSYDPDIDVVAFELIVGL